MFIRLLDSPYNTTAMWKPHKRLRSSAARLIAPIAATPNIPPVVFSTCPMANPKARLATSNESATIPAHSALLISLFACQCPDQALSIYLSTYIRANIPSSPIFPLPILRSQQKPSYYTLSYAHHAYQKQVFRFHVVVV